MKYYMNNSYEMLQATRDCECLSCPQKLYLDITEDCNLWCKMCRDERTVSSRTMTKELFERLVDETAPYVRSYSLFNWGEPLMVKDFRERVEYVNKRKRSDCNVEISTNGMLLDEDILSFLVSQRVEIIISVDGADKNTFEAIRRGASFDRVVKNAKNAAAAYADFPCERAPQFYISIQNDNQNQVLDTVRLAQSLGIRRFGCGIVVSPERFAPQQDEKLCRELESAYRFIRDNGMFLDVHPTRVGGFVLCGDSYEDASDYIVDTVCFAPLVSATVAYNGDVYLCCNVGEKVANVCDESFLELWQSARYNELRRTVNDESRMPRHCKGCAWFNRNKG